MVEVNKTEIMEVKIKQTPTFDEQPKANTSETGTIVEMLQKFSFELSELRKRFDNQQDGYRSRSRSRPRSRTYSRSSSTANPHLCWYHNEFGAEAKKCARRATKSQHIQNSTLLSMDNSFIIGITIMYYRF